MIGVIMAGWGSNNKYSLMGGLRSAAQMISYELPLVLALAGVVMLTSALAGTPGYPGNAGIGTIAISQMQNFQSVNFWPFKGVPFFDFVFEGFTPWAWFILIQPLMLIIYYTCGLAETNRAPFDLPEAESELVAGYLTEYSGIRWAFFFLGEYGNMTVVSAITAYLFLGGWSGPGVAYLVGLGSLGWGLLGNLLGVTYFITKVYVLCFVFIWVRSTLPRLRADQLMQFAWLILIPITLFNILLTGLIFLVVNSLGLGSWTSLVFLVVTAILNWAMLYGFVWIVGRTTTSTTQRAQAPAIRAQQRTGTAVQVPERTGVAGGQLFLFCEEVKWDAPRCIPFHFFAEVTLAQQFVWMELLLERTETISPGEKEEIHKELMMYDPLWEEHPKVKKIRVESRTEGEVQAMRSAIVTVVKVRYPELGEMAQQKVEEINTPEVLKFLLAQISAEPEEMGVRSMLRPTAA